MQEIQIQTQGQEDLPGEWNGHLLQYSCLKNPIDRGTWQATSPCSSKELDALTNLTLSLQIKFVCALNFRKWNHTVYLYCAQLLSLCKMSQIYLYFWNQ